MRTAIVRIAVAAALLSGSARAQSGTWESSSSTYRTHRPDLTLLVVNWEVAAPIGSFSDYTDDWSFRGASFEFRRFLGETLSVGLSFSWNRFEQDFDLMQVPINNGVVSGPLYRYASFFGARGIAHYYLLPGALQPYLGVGVGGVWTYSYQQAADIAYSQDSFDFIVDPEVGLLYWVSRGGGTTWAVNVAFRYTFTTADVGVQPEDNAQFLSGIFGVAFGY